jgi:hypothetical protein
LVTATFALVTGQQDAEASTSISQHDSVLIVAVLVTVESQQQLSPQQTGPQQQASAQSSPQQQLSPQQQANAVVAFGFSAAAPMPIAPAKANAPTMPNNRRRFMIHLPTT